VLLAVKAELLPCGVERNWLASKVEEGEVFGVAAIAMLAELAS
jgi:hypothetical protein